MNGKKLLILLLILSFTKLAFGITNDSKVYLNAALKTAQWLEAVRMERPEGLAWAADPKNPLTHTLDLYNGTYGVPLFFLELYHVTKNKNHLQVGLSGVDYCLSAFLKNIKNLKDAGLYTGIAGLGFVLGEAYSITGDEKYLIGINKCITQLEKLLVETGRGNKCTEVTDIIGGNAGIGLYLLQTFRKFNLNQALSMAKKIGWGLMFMSEIKNTGLSWPYKKGYQRIMPNFAHGTAGVAYFMARLYEETREKEFLKAALWGGNRLLSITHSGLICHHLPDGENLFYLGWCHGPVGTGRLYYKLWQITKDKKWKSALFKGAKAIMEGGIPQKRVEGFWNNVGLCCGSAGVAEYFLNLYKITGSKKYLKFVYHLTEDLLKRSTDDELGKRWIQAEHRTRPDFLLAQTGLMQGAAGIGLWLLRLYQFEKNQKSLITFPDTPFINK